LDEQESIFDSVFYSSILEPGVTCSLCWSLHGSVFAVGSEEYYIYRPKLHNYCYCQYIYFSSDDHPELDIKIPALEDTLWLHAYHERIPAGVYEKLFGNIIPDFEAALVEGGMTTMARNLWLEVIAFATGAGLKDFSARRAEKYAKKIAEIRGHKEVWASDMALALELAKWNPDDAETYLADDPEKLKWLEEVR